MIIKSKALEIIEKAPFTNDLLSRKESADALTSFILSTDEPLVICIDAPWGQGKTSFLKMWEQDLVNRKIPTIYYNAWESDFTDDALISLIGEVSASISRISENGDKPKALKHLKKAKKLGVALLKNTLPIATKIATSGLLDMDKITEKALSDFTETVVKDKIDKYEESKNSLISFRHSLTDLAASISSPDNPLPLVFIIDELDRCRPTFAIEVLEKAKHFFNVKNIVFILGADKTQLGHSIKAIYGRDIDVDGYLRRFIDIDYLLPSPEKGLFIKALFSKYSFTDYFSKKQSNDLQYEGEQALKIFTELFDVYKLSLREQEHCCSLLSISIKTTPDNHKLHPLFLCFLIVIKIKRNELYSRLIKDEITPPGVLNYLKSNSGSETLLEDNYGMALEAYIVSCRAYEHSYEDILEPYDNILKSEASSKEEKYRATRIMEILKNFSWHGGIGTLESLVSKIEIASRFTN